MQRDRNAERECPHCGEQIGGTVHMCPHCRKSLATLDQKEWERASPISRSEGAPPPETSTGLKRLLFSPFAAFTIIAAAFVLTLVFYPGADDTAGKGDIYRAPAPPYGAPPSKRPEAPERHELTTIPGSDAPVSPAKRAAAESAKRAGISEQAVARKRKIKSISNDIFHKLKEEEAVTTDTIYLKSGREMQCTVIDDLGDQLKVRYKGVTTIIEKTDVEQMKRLSQQAVDMRMRRMSLEQARRIVDQGLVPYGGDWITPEERDIKKQKARATLKKAEIESRKLAQAETARPTKAPRAISTPPTIGGRSQYASVTVTEGIGFGDVIVGHPRCTRRFLISKFGKPDTVDKTYLNYFWKHGFRFRLSESSDMLTEIKFNKRFTGKLRSGITTSSSLDDVLAAYGYPINEIETDSLIEDPHDYANRTLYTKDHRAKIWYRDLGLVFYFEENTVRVFWIIRI